MNRSGKERGFRALVLAAAIAAVPGATRAQYVPIYGGMSYDPASGNGYNDATFEGSPGSTPVNSAGYAFKYVSGVYKGERAVRWDAAGNALELDNLGTNPSGIATGDAYSINASGLVAGAAEKYVGGTNKGSRPVRWDAAGHALELGVLGTDSSGATSGSAYSINTVGQTAGYVGKSVGGVGMVFAPFAGTSAALRWNSAIWVLTPRA